MNHNVHSWDEMAQYDLPATVDKILNITKVSQVFFVGHSQGGTIGFAQLAQDPTFASKIKLFAPLAPAVYMNGIQSPIRVLAPLANDIGVILGILNISYMYLKFAVITEK